jgi:uncharacterized protein
MRRFCTLLGIVIFLCTGPVAASDYPSVADLHFNDFANLVDVETEESTRAALSALLSQTGIEMTVVTIRSRQDYDASGDLEDFTKGLFNDWGVGDATRNDGILLLVVGDDRETRIQLGSAYNQGYDVIAQDIVSSDMVPYFRGGAHGEGIERGVVEVIDRVALRHAEDGPIDYAPVTNPGLFERFDGWLFGIVFAGIAAYGLFGRRIGDGMTRFRRCPGCGRRGLHSERGIRPATDAGEVPMELHRISCRHCDFREDREPRAMKTQAGRRSGSDRGGFGGGKSSGGGASGRW